MRIRDEALKLAALGLPVFPCHSDPGKERDKTPYSRNSRRNGFYDATTDAEQIRCWWSQPWMATGTLIGVRMGQASGIAALDIDPRHGGDRWEADNANRLPRTRVHATRSGGRHYLFKWPSWLGIPGIADGVDTRGQGGYIIWWPASGFDVLVDVPLDALPDWPNWLKPKPEAAKPRSAEHSRSQARQTRPVRLPDRYQIERLANWVVQSRDGQRNKCLFWAACRVGEMLLPGILEEEEAIGLLLPAALRVGLDERKAIASIRSGLNREQG